MTVSIVIPCYNGARYLAEAIESALTCRADLVRSAEVIVVDDGSTDHSAAIAASYPSVRLLRQDNRGLAAARNRGLSAARGDIVIFLDADDRLYPNAARVAVETLTRHPDAAMVFGNCQLIDEAGSPLATNVPFEPEPGYAALLHRNFVWTPAVAACRRTVFDELGGFDAAVNASADYDLYLRIARRYPIVGHGHTVADYRQHGASMSSNPALMLATTLRVLRAQRPYVRSNRLLAAHHREGVRSWREFYGERLVQQFRDALHDGRWLAALADAARLLRWYPAGVVRHLRKKARLLLTPTPHVSSS